MTSTVFRILKNADNQSVIKSPKQALNPAFLKQKPERKEIELFKKEFIKLLDVVSGQYSTININIPIFQWRSYRLYFSFYALFYRA